MAEAGEQLLASGCVATSFVLGGSEATPVNNLPGNCSTVGLTTVGPTFGQDGVRVTAGSTAQIVDNTISANLVHGIGAPAYGSATNNTTATGAGAGALGAAVTSGGVSPATAAVALDRVPTTTG